MSNKSEAFTFGPVTLAFCSAFEPSAPRGTQAEPKFNTGIVISAEQYRDIVYPRLSAFAAEAFKNNETTNPKFKWPFHECAHSAKSYPLGAERGMYHANLKSGFPLQFVDANRQPILDPLLLKDGAQVYVNMSFRSYNKAGGLGIAADPGPFMLVGQGEVLNSGGGANVEEAFAGIEVDAGSAPAPSATVSAAPTPPAPPVATQTQPATTAATAGLPPTPPIPR